MQAKEKAKWTFMVYLAGDNDLSAAGDKDLDEMRSIGSTDEVNIIVEFDNAGDRGTVRYHVQRDGVGEHEEALGETDSGDPKVLLDFIQWAAENYPAERYGLVLWNHGGGWEPEEMDRVARSVNAVDYNEREAGERSASSLGRAFFRTTLEKIYSLQTVQDRAICSDDGSGHSLDTIELGKVLKKTKELLGQPLDLLGMDACLMSNLEVAYQARHYVQHIVASEENEPNDGWPYDAVLRKLVEESEIATPDLATHIVEAYVQSYVDRGYASPVTQAALDLSQVETLAGPLDDLAEALIPHMPAGRYELGDALYETSAHFWKGTLWDIANVCEELGAKTQDQKVLQAAQAVRAVLQPQSDTFVIAESHNGKKVEHCGGVTIYLPPRILHTVSRFYKDLDFAQEHRWLAMLQAYHGA